MSGFHFSFAFYGLKIELRSVTRTWNGHNQSPSNGEPWHFLSIASGCRQSVWLQTSDVTCTLGLARSDTSASSASDVTCTLRHERFLCKWRHLQATSALRNAIGANSL